MGELNENVGVNKFLLMLKGICISMGITIIMLFILSIILSFSDVKESVIMPTVIFISSFSILIGGFLIAKKIDEKGIIYGSALGLLYMLILYLISSIMNFNFSLTINAIVMIAVGVIGGAIGGILGVNLK
jgi:putative membrane protein (TIGR04086 family)